MWDDMTKDSKTVSTNTKKKQEKAGAGLAGAAGVGDTATGGTFGEALWDTLTNPNKAIENIAEVGKDAAKAAKQAAVDIAAATKKTLTEGAKRTEKILLLVAVIAFFVAQSKS